MSNLKGIDLLEIFLNDWLHKKGFKEVKAEVAPDFGFLTYSNTIQVALLVNDKEGEAFKDFFYERFNFPYEADIFLLSFFHELGHYATIDFWTEKDWASYSEIDWADLPMVEYFSTPIEYEASAWANNFIKEHEKEVADFWRMCAPIIQSIYKINEVED